MRPWAWGLGTLVALVACQAVPPGAGGQASGAASTPTAAGPADPKALAGPVLPLRKIVSGLPGGRRVATTLGDPDPGLGKTLRVSEYWDYESATPYEVEDVEIQSRPLAGAAGQRVSMVADVKLPTAKAWGYRAYRADGTASGEVEVNPNASGPAPAARLAGDQTEESISPESDDFPGKHSYFLDPNGNGQWDEGEQDPAPEGMDEGAEDRILMAPHRVRLEVDDHPLMGEAKDVLRLLDEVSQQRLEVQHDQGWDRFEATNSAGKLEVLFQPDGSFRVDGKAHPNGDSVSKALALHPVMLAAGHHNWALLAARLGRIGPVRTRRAPPCGGTGQPPCPVGLQGQQSLGLLSVFQPQLGDGVQDLVHPYPLVSDGYLASQQVSIPGVTDAVYMPIQLNVCQLLSSTGSSCQTVPSLP